MDGCEGLSIKYVWKVFNTRKFPLYFKKKKQIDAGVGENNQKILNYTSGSKNINFLTKSTQFSINKLIALWLSI
jgi:hypothetical protein